MVERLSNFGTKALIEQLYASSLTVVSNEDQVIPVKHLDLENMASLTIGRKGETFKNTLVNIPNSNILHYARIAIRTILLPWKKIWKSTAP